VNAGISLRVRFRHWRFYGFRETARRRSAERQEGSKDREEKTDDRLFAHVYWDRAWQEVAKAAKRKRRRDGR